MSPFATMPQASTWELYYYRCMVKYFDYLRNRLDTSIWFIPVCISTACFALGMLILWVERHVTYSSASLQTFAMPVESARQVLSVIAGSVISVGGVSFSVTMVALTLTSGQYGPKILRHFLEDNSSKVSLGLFLGAYVYALVVLTAYSETDRPHLTVLMALLLALFAVVGFIRFIHRTATDLQADEIVERIGQRLQVSLVELASEGALRGRSCDVAAWRRAARGQRPQLIASNGQGYVQAIDYRELLKWCAEHNCRMQVRARAGDFLVNGICVFKVYGCPADAIDAAFDHLNSHVITGPIRTSVQDPEYPITQLNQLAARALSPGINDPGTAKSCVDSFSLALAYIVDRDLPGSVFMDDEGEPRLLLRFTSFDGIMKAVFAQLRQFAKSEVSVVVSLLDALCRLAQLTTRRERLQVLGFHGDLIREEIDDQALAAYDLLDIRQRHKRLRRLVQRLDCCRNA
ncbi:MAG: DUF2254 domain-containing protein [Gammaproteobacteria bacterium]|nr:DUF2254 domain-containing protein [Gammaproteobacteria bacterium]